MNRRLSTALLRARSIGLGCAARAARFLRNRAGVAAVEFALILPVMLGLYFGCVVLSQGLDAGRKTQLLSRTLADLTAQQLPGQDTSGTCASYTSVPCVEDSVLSNYFGAATKVLFPFGGATNMTISEIIFDNVSATNTACCVARVMWSVGMGPNPTLRPCGVLSQSANGVNGPTQMPMGAYPGGKGDALNGTPYVASNNGVDTYLIVADVNYNYNPGFGFTPYAWNKAANNGSGYTIRQTTYMTPRNGANTAIQWTPGSTFTKYNSCPNNTSSSSAYNTP